jgi:hypothetical protein
LLCTLSWYLSGTGDVAPFTFAYFDTLPLRRRKLI